MAVLHPQPTGDQLAARPPFDHKLSRHLDAIILRLDARPRLPARVYLRLRKRIAERNVPAFYASREVR